MNRILIFNSTKGGHFAEWIQHLLNEAYKDNENFYYFVIPQDTKELNINNKNNVTINYLEEEEIDFCNNHSLLYDAYKKTILLKKYAKKYDINKIFLISLMHHLPFCCMMLPSKIELSGIIYRIYLYEWKEINLLKKAIEISKYLTIKYSNIKKVFILNGNFIANYINKIYNTNVFSNIVDPFNAIEYNAKNLRKEFGIIDESKVFIHIGALTERKGTLTILDAINLIPDIDKSKFTFIFAGKVHDEIKEQFYNKIKTAGKDAKILIFDKFCDDEFFHDLCYTCDGILIPYQNTTQSSGIIGWAAKYNKKVVGPSEGLLGKLIQIYKLGYRIKNINSEKLKESFYLDFSENKTSYINVNQTRYFLETIFNELKK